MARSESITCNSPAIGKRVFAKQYGSTVLGQGLTLGLGILTGILSARILGPVGRGEFAALTIWPLAVVTLLSIGMNQAITYNIGSRAFTARQVASASTVIGLVQGLISVIVGLVAVNYALAKYAREVQHLAIAFVLFTPALILSGFPASIFQGVQDLLRFNLIRVAAPFVYCVSLVWLYFTHRGTLSSVLSCQLAGYVLALLLGVGMAWHALKPRLEWNPSAIPRLLNYGCRTQATSLTYYFNQRIDQLVLSQFVPPQQLGFYAVAVTLSSTVTVVPQAIGIVAFSKGSSQHHDDARETIGESFRASLIWLFIYCSSLYALTPLLIHLVFGNAFSGSILACRILLPGSLLMGLNHVLYNGASALGRPGLPSLAEGISMVVTAVGLCVLVPRYGYIGAAIVSSLAYSLSFLVLLALSHRLLGLTVSVLLFGSRR